MKRLDLTRHIEAHGCEFLREGGNCTIYINRLAQRVSSIPRDREINDFICWDLQVPDPTATYSDFQMNKPQ